MAHVLDANGRDQVYFGSSLAMVYQWADDDLRSDVGTASGTTQTLSRYDTETASGLQVIYDTSVTLVTGSLVGAPIEITTGVAKGVTQTVAYNTVTGIIVVDDFSTTPEATASFVVGVVDSFYTTALAAGAKDNGAPGYRKEYWPGYYAAFVHDADGNNVFDPTTGDLTEEFEETGPPRHMDR